MGRRRRSPRRRHRAAARGGRGGPKDAAARAPCAHGRHGDAAPAGRPAHRLLGALGLVGCRSCRSAPTLDEVRAGRSTATALVEESFFVGEHGVHLAALASGARFTADANGALGLPFPVDQAGDVPGRDGGLRIFSYTDAMPAYVFLPALVLLFALLILAALYAGFAAARAVGAATPALGAAWAR